MIIRNDGKVFSSRFRYLRGATCAAIPDGHLAASRPTFLVAISREIVTYLPGWYGLGAYPYATRILRRERIINFRYP